MIQSQLTEKVTKHEKLLFKTSLWEVTEHSTDVNVLRSLTDYIIIIYYTLLLYVKLKTKF